MFQLKEKRHYFWLHFVLMKGYFFLSSERSDIYSTTVCKFLFYGELRVDIEPVVNLTC